ncbi:MAG: DUF2130 domain-containing protein [Eubacteriales bacterium]|nr:DUF2130 domain-containing protein [Eubacteriales bacterium]
MSATTVICPYCKKQFEISDAIQRQIEDELIRAKDEQSETLRKEFETLAGERTRQAVENALEEARQAADLMLEHERHKAVLELEKAKQTTAFELEKSKQATEFEAERLRRQAQAARESEKELREKMTALLDELEKANKARDEAQTDARKDMMEKEKAIRQEVTQKTSEDFYMKIREQEETINRLREQLTTAKQVAEQGSQQLQGEILELDIERSLAASFPLDTIDEVKKGERGSDIRHVVNDRLHQNCGLILWECKNAKTYQAGWQGKLKDEMAAEKAQAGVIVFQATDGSGEDFQQLADNIWLVKPRYAMMLAAFLRDAIIRVFIANRNAQGKDIKTELVYNYLTGGEFSNRVRYIIESYDEMAKQLDTEKKQAHRRWAAQEKILEKVTSSLYGMSGDLQGIAGKEIIALPGHGMGEDLEQ